MKKQTETEQYFSDNLNFYLKAKGKKQKDLYEYFDYSAGAISNWLRGNKFPPINTIVQIADFLDITVDQLLYNREETNEESRKNFIPVLGKVRAGVPTEAVQDIIDYEEIPDSLAKRGEYFGLQIQGDSMSPRFCEGDIVIVRKQPDIDSGDIGIVLVNDSDATIKKVVKFNGGINLVPFNSAFEIQTYSNQQIETLPVQIIGKVVELRAKF